MSKQQNNEQQPKSRAGLIRSAMLAMMSLLLTVAVAASLTFALFVNEIPNNQVRIEAGDLAVEAKLIKLEGWKIDTEASKNGAPNPDYGRLVEFSEPVEQDLAEYSDAGNAIFKIEHAVPTQHQTATIEIKNGGSIAFDCKISISEPKGLNDPESSEDKALKSQILITMQLGTNEPKVFLLSEYDKDQNVINVGDMKPGQTETLTITALFFNDAEPAATRHAKNTLVVGDNAKAMGGGVYFDFTLIATQTTAAS